MPVTPAWFQRITKVILRVPAPLDPPLDTPANIFGLFRRYLSVPTYNPDAQLKDNQQPVTVAPSVADAPIEGPTYFAPFQNYSQYAFAKFWSENHGGQLSDRFFEQALDLFRHTQFKPLDLLGFTMKKMKDILLPRLKNHPEEVNTAEGWKTNVPVNISIPEGKTEGQNPNSTRFSIPGLNYRPIMEIIKEVYSTAKNIHYSPFKLITKPLMGNKNAYMANYIHHLPGLWNRSSFSSYPHWRYNKIFKDGKS